MRTLLLLCLSFAALGGEPAATPAATTAVEAPFELITPAEAAAEEAAPTRGAFRELADGPLIQVESPDPSTPHPSPFPITVLFTPGPSGKAPDPASLQVMYVKLIALDITGRIEPFLAADGIRVPSAKIPAGNHTLRVFLSDTAGNLSAKELTVTVAN